MKVSDTFITTFITTSKEAERRVRAEGGKPTDAHSEAARLMLESYLKG